MPRTRSELEDDFDEAEELDGAEELDDGAGEELDDEADEADEDEADEDEAVAPPESKKKRTAQDRIKELAKARRESEKAAYEAELRARELEDQIRAMESEKPAAVAPKEPDPKDYRYGEVDKSYLDDLVDYRVAKREFDARAARDSGSTERRAEEENAGYRRRLSEVMEQGVKKYRGFQESIQNTVYDPSLARAVLDSPHAVDIAYHLSKNVSDLRDLTRSPPQERLRKLGRLEGRFSAASAVKKKSKAPKVPAAGTRKPISKDPKGRLGPDDQDEFDKAFFGN